MAGNIMLYCANSRDLGQAFQSVIGGLASDAKTASSSQKVWRKPSLVMKLPFKLNQAGLLEHGLNYFRKSWPFFEGNSCIQGLGEQQSS